MERGIARVSNHNNPFNPQYQPLQQPFPPPQQQFPSPQQPSRRRLVTALVFNVLVFVVAIISLCTITFAFGGSILSSISNSLAGSHGPYAVGDTITVDGAACTMTSIKMIDVIFNEVLIAHVEIVNNSGNEINYSYTDFHLETDNGLIIDVNDSADSNLGQASLAPNGKIVGDIAFEIRQPMKGAILWQPGSSQSLSYKWQFDMTNVTPTPYLGSTSWFANYR